MFNKNMKKIFIALVLKYLTVRCNRSLDIHNKGDCFDVTGNKCLIHSVNDVKYVTEQHHSIECIKKSALCKILSKIHCTQEDSCKLIANQHFLPNIISMNLNCTENELVSVFGGQILGYWGSQIDIRHKGMYSKCEHRSCNNSFCCMNNHPVGKYMHNLKSDDLLLLKWNQDCEQKQTCTIQVPRWDMLTEPDKNTVIQGYKNDCPSSYPFNARRMCMAIRVNVQYHCLPEDYPQLVSNKGKKSSLVFTIFYLILRTYKVV